MLKIQFRRSDDATWTSINPILGLGEPGYNATLKKMKIGDGFTRWNSLPYSLSKTPSSSSDNGTKGDICWDNDYIYVCVDTNTWKRSGLSTW